MLENNKPSIHTRTRKQPRASTPNDQNVSRRKRGNEGLPFRSPEATLVADRNTTKSTTHYATREALAPETGEQMNRSPPTGVVPRSGVWEGCDEEAVA